MKSVCRSFRLWAFMIVSAAYAHAGTPCENLTSLTLTGVRVIQATPVASAALPAHCRVIGVATPPPDSNINFEVWIPPDGAWNGKFQGIGNGGFQGSISVNDMAAALKRGYATAGTDAGHVGDDLRFA